MKLTKYFPYISMGLMLLIVQIIAVALSKPLEINEFKAFENPDDTTNVFVWVAIILIFTAFIFLIIKLNKKWMITAIIYFTIVSTLYYVFFALFSMFLPEETNFILTIVLSVGLTLILYKFPEWYIINFIGIIIGGGAASMFGISLAIIPTLLLLIILAIYDYIAVYQTKHMIALAEGVMDLKLPILFVIPKHWKYSFLTETFDKEEREAFFMGLGDAVIPTLLVVSANFFIKTDFYLFGIVNLPAIGAIIGSLIGFSVLMVFVSKGKAQAGLPFLNGGVIIGYIVGSLIAGTPIV